MSGFHLVLGLLAVAVCISPSKGAPLPAIQNDDITAQNLQSAELRIAVKTGTDDGSPQRILYNNKKEIAKRDDSQYTNVIEERSLENDNQRAGFAKVINLRSKDTDAVSTNAKAAESGSGPLDDATQESSGIMTHHQQSLSEESASDSEASNTAVSNESDGSGLGSEIVNSESAEECDEENNGDSDGKGTVSRRPTKKPNVKEETTKATDENASLPSPTETPGENNEGCEDSEATPESSTPETPVASPTSPEEPNSTSQESEESQGSQEDEECGDGEPTTTTKSTPRRTTTTTRLTRKTHTSTTTRPTRKTQDPDDSSGSFNKSDPDGVDFSDSNSSESNGSSTDLSDK